MNCMDSKTDKMYVKFVVAYLQPKHLNQAKLN